MLASGSQSERHGTEYKAGYSTATVNIVNI